MTTLPVRVERVIEHLKDGTDTHVVQLAVDPRQVLPELIRVLVANESIYRTDALRLTVRALRPGSPNWRAALERIAAAPQIQTALTIVLDVAQAVTLVADIDDAVECMRCDCGRLVDIDGPQCSACVEYGEYRDAGLHR